MADEVKGPVDVWVQTIGRGKDAKYRVIKRNAAKALLVTADRKEAMAKAKEAAGDGTIEIGPIETTTGPVPSSQGDAG